MTWAELNQRHLVAHLGRVRRLLQRHAGVEPSSEEEPAEIPLAEAAGHLPGLPALDALVRAFDLTPFERDVLLLAAASELDGEMPALCAAASGDARRAHATFGLALAIFPDAHWSALSPDAPLRHWRLVEPEPGAGLAYARLRVAERVLHHLVGVGSLDPLLRDAVEPVAPPPEAQELPPAARRVAAAWSLASAGETPPVVVLCGADAATARDVAAGAAYACGMRLHAVRFADVSSAPSERRGFARLWEREAVLSGSALLVHADDADSPEQARALAGLVEAIGAPLAVAARDGAITGTRAALRVDVERPTPEESARAWREALGADAREEEIQRAAGHFLLSRSAMRAVAAEARLSQGDLWGACRAQARPRLEGLAERIRSDATWDDIILPPAMREILHDVVAQVRAAPRVLHEWGFARRSSRGLGVTALFAGPSGTGKTLAAEVVANELDLDLYRVDLSQVVNKYVGETEKNLRRIFDLAEAGGAVLLFDEADALFGKRSEVKDSHDRYANLEVSYLLQRMEAYRGLAILTSNMKASIDPAFLRRLRYVLTFPFPDAPQRADIWRRAFPPETPTQGLDPEKLARLNVAGGGIRAIATNAAFLAADAGGAVRMEHVLRAARAEYAKTERAPTAAEVAGWV